MNLINYERLDFAFGYIQKKAADFTRCAVMLHCVAGELKPLSFIASLTSENFVVQNLVVIGHSHKASVSI